MRLVAVIDAGNKSCHGWFQMPPQPHVEELQIILPALGCDAGMFRPSQPARLAGIKRGKRWHAFVIKKNEVEERLVQLGPTPGPGQVSIVDGVAKGEKVVTKVTDQIDDGTRVRE